MFVYIFLLTTTVFGQLKINENVKWEKYIPTPGQEKPLSIIGHDNKFIYVVRHTVQKREKVDYAEKYYINSLTLQKSNELKLKVGDIDLSIKDQFIFNDKPVLLAYSINLVSSRVQYYLCPINPIELVFDEFIKLPEIKIEGLVGNINEMVFSLIAEAAIKFVISDDKKSACIVAGSENLRTDSDKSKNNQFTYSFLDSNLNKTEDIKINLPWNYYQYTQVELGNNGLLYSLGYNYNFNDGLPPTPESLQSVSDSIHMIITNVKNGDTEIIDIDNEGKKIDGLKFSVNSDGSFNIIALTAYDSGELSGTVFIKYSNSYKEIDRSYHIIDNTLIETQWTTQEELEENKTAPSNLFKFELSEIITNNNGTYTLMAEQHYEKIGNTGYQSMQPNGQLINITELQFYRKNILVLNFNQEGYLNWEKVVIKSQLNKNEKGSNSSYCYIGQNKGVSIIYNAPASTIINTTTLSKKEKRAADRKIVSIQVFIDESGNQNRSILFDHYHEGEMELQPQATKNNQKKLSVIYAKGRLGDKIGTIVCN